MRNKLLIGLLTASAMACLMACGGGDEVIDMGSAGADQGMMERSGPAGCYILADNSCDCDIAEDDCTEDGVQLWTDGCDSCAD